jgi:phenylpropionate dioxygenase-like ring-hydroxylating dioxygenase large terminal subunit
LHLRPSASWRGHLASVAPRRLSGSGKDGLVWVRLVDNGPKDLPELVEWDDPDCLQVPLHRANIQAAAGRQVEGFLDVSHFAFIHKENFGESDNPVVPDYKVTKTDRGFVAD